MGVSCCNLPDLLIDIHCNRFEPYVVFIGFVDSKLSKLIIAACFDFVATCQKKSEIVATGHLSDVCFQQLVYDLWLVRRRYLLAQTQGSLSVESPRVHIPLPIEGDCVLLSARNLSYMALQQVINKGRRLDLQSCSISLTEFAVLVAAKRVYLTLLCQNGCVVPPASNLFDTDVPCATLGLRVVLLLRSESQLATHVQTPHK